MCNPAIAAVLAAVTAAYSVNQQNKMADKQADAIEAQAATNIAALHDRSEEITEKVDMEKFERKKQLQRKVSAQRVSQSEGGVLFGNTAARGLIASFMEGSQDDAMINKEHTNLQSQIGRQMESVSTGAALQMSGIKWTNPLMASASAGINAYGGAGGFST